MPISLAPVNFVLGVGRSGTTLLRVMLEGHSQLFAPPEMVLAPFATMEQRKAQMSVRYWEKGGLRRAMLELTDLDVDAAKEQEDAMADWDIPQVYAWLQERMGGRTLVDKCPHLSYSPEALERLVQWFPEARFVWIVRHPGAVLRSFQNMPFAEAMFTGVTLSHEQYWAQGNANIQKFLAGRDPSTWVRVRYEDLVTEPEQTMQSIMDCFGLPFEDGLLTPYDGDRMREGPKGARAVGDPQMAARGRIQPELANKWLDGFDPSVLSPASLELARSMGYDIDLAYIPPLKRSANALATLMKTATELSNRIDMPDELDAVEGQRFLLRMVSASLDTFVEYGDVQRPQFFNSEGPTRKMFADNPDTDYWRAPIRTAEGQVYRVTGWVPSETLYWGVLYYGKGGQVCKSLSDSDIEVGPDGQFTLYLSVKRPDEPGDWLEADGEETAFMVRQYFGDREAERPLELAIELVDGPELGEPLQALVFEQQLGQATRMLKAIYKRTWGMLQFARSAALNNFRRVGGDELFPTPDNVYHAAWWRLGEAQVAFVRGRIPDCRYFSVVLYNAWMESLDYTLHPISLNHTEIELDEDGNFELVLSHHEVDHPNWLDTAGHKAGYVLCRALLPDDEGEVGPYELEIAFEREWASRRRQ